MSDDPHPDSDQSTVQPWELERAQSAAERLAAAIDAGAVDGSHANIGKRLLALVAWPAGWFPSNIRTATDEAERLVKEATHG